MSFSTSDRFSHLDAKDRDRLETLSKLDQFGAGAEISSTAQPAEWIYLIADGSVQVRGPAAQGEVTLGELKPGDLFGELETFADLPPGIRHVASADTIVRAVPKGPLKSELRQHRSLATGLLTAYCRSISEKVRATNEVAARMGPARPQTRPPPSTLASAVAQAGGAAAPEPVKNGPLGRPSHLTAEQAGWLSVLGQRFEVGEGDVVVAEGDRTRSFYVIEAGELEVRKRIGGGDKALARLGPRDLFGVMSFVDGKPRSASVVALRPSVLNRVEGDVLDKAMGLNFTVSFKFLGSLCSVLGRTWGDTARQVIAAAS